MFRIRIRVFLLLKRCVYLIRGDSFFWGGNFPASSKYHLLIKGYTKWKFLGKETGGEIWEVKQLTKRNLCSYTLT